MPIRDIVVDWNDGTGASGYFGKYKNNLKDCNPEMDVPGILNSWQGFGGTEGACHEGYKVIYNQYFYDAAFPCDGGVINIDGTNYDVPDIPDASCYKPYVELIA